MHRWEDKDVFHKYVIKKKDEEKNKRQNKPKHNFFANVLRREKTDTDHSQNFYEINAYCPTNKISVTT